jgi:hypothetical protein
MQSRRATNVLLLVAALAGALQAQTTPIRTGGKAFVIEAAGGTIGAAAGIGLGIGASLVNKCATDDDVVCPLEKVALVGAFGATGTVLGVWIGGKKANTRPSVYGAAVGALAGAAVGLLIHKGLSDASGEPAAVATVALFSVSQGLLAAAASRIIASSRPR